MEAYKTITQFNERLHLWLKNLPIKTGQKIEVIVISSEKRHIQRKKNIYSLKGSVLKYDAPFVPAVSDSDWEVLK